MRARLLLLGLIALLALVLGWFTFTPLQGVMVVRFGGYWFVLAATAAFAVTFGRSLRDSGPAWRAWRSWWKPALVVAAVTVFLNANERHELKIVADEVILQLTAKQMHFAREVAVVVRGYEYAGNFTPMATYVDKRPLFYPFLLATVHDLTGYRVGNAYVLNAALSAVLLTLVLLIGRRIAGWAAGIAGVLLVATIPLVAQNACGGGFEMLNLVMIALTWWLGLRAAERPDDDRLGAFVLSGVLLAQVRYESVLFIVPVGAAVAYLWWRERNVRLPWSLYAAPLLLVVCPLHLNVFKLSQAAWQLNDVQGADAPFGLKYFYENCGHALNFFLCFDGSQPNSVLVGIVGVLAIGLFVLLLYRQHREIFAERPVHAVCSIFLLGLLLHTFVMLCYFWGKWDDPVIHRLSLPANLMLALAIVFVWEPLVKWDRRWPLLSGIALLYIVSMTAPSNAMHRFTQENFAARSTNWLAEYLRKQGDRSALAIDRNAGLLWFLYDKSSTTTVAVATRPEALITHFRNHSFQDFYVIQRAGPELATGRRLIDINDDFGDAVQLELIEERAFAPLYLVRLSRIVKIDEDKLREWAKRRQSHPPVERPNTPLLTPDEDKTLLEWLRQLP